MSVTSGFFNSLNGDRRYNAEQFSALFDNLITDGIFSNVGTAFSVSANTDESVVIGIGRAWFNSVWIYNDALLQLPVRASEILLNRIDAVVIEVNRTDAVRAASIRFVYGSPATNPEPPSMTKTDDIHQYPLAYVYRRAGDNSVIQADITNMIGSGECPYVTGILETQDISAIVAQWESEFNIWFEGLQEITEGDFAANLANKVIELETRFEELASDHSVTSELEDSNGNNILDHSSGKILGRTVFALRVSQLPGNTIQVSSEPSQKKDDFKIGDIKVTSRTDLGENWLLCNGSVLSAEEYPEYYDAVPNNRRFNNALWKETLIAQDVQSDNLSSVVKYFGEDKQAFFVKDYDNSCYRIFIKENGVWSDHVISGLTYSSGDPPFGKYAYWITKIGEQYVLPKHTVINYNTRSVAIYVSNDLITWTEKTISLNGWTSSSASYEDQYIRIIFQDPQSGKLFLLASQDNTAGTKSYYYANIAFADNINSTFMFQATPPFKFDSISDKLYFSAANGFCFFAYQEYVSSAGTTGRVVKMNVGTKTYEVGQITSSVTSYYDSEVSSPVGYCDGCYYLLINRVLLKSTDGITWTQLMTNMTNSSVPEDAKFANIVFQGEERLILVIVYNTINQIIVYEIRNGAPVVIAEGAAVGGEAQGKTMMGDEEFFFGSDSIFWLTSKLGSQYYEIREHLYAPFDTVKLPSITADGAYYYAKVKE